MTLNNTSKATQLIIAKLLAHLNIISKSRFKTKVRVQK